MTDDDDDDDDDNCKIDINEDARSDISNPEPLIEMNDDNQIESQSLTTKSSRHNSTRSRRSKHKSVSSSNSKSNDEEEHDSSSNARGNNANADGEGTDDDEEEGLKLGLGDFVFYSVLIARAAMHDWITTFSCAVAVLTGLTLTIFLLSIYQKALPALPISIVLGIIFYVISSSMLSPLMKYLTRIPIVEANMNNYSGLKLHMDNGCGFVYI